MNSVITRIKDLREQNAILRIGFARNMTDVLLLTLETPMSI
jgi:hypothetical protein